MKKNHSVVDADFEQLYSVDLVCDPELEEFYARAGGRLHTSMVWRNYARQAGQMARVGGSSNAVG